MWLHVLLVFLVAALAVEATKPNILFLMCDSMDGRVLDPTSAVYHALEMPNLRKLASSGVNFINTYAASPQCVPSRTTMFTGRRIDHTHTFSNEQGVAGVPSKPDELDTNCVKKYDKKTCRGWQKEQNVTATLVDSLRSLKYEPHLYGKVDVGAGILSDSDEKNATETGFHGGPSLSTCTRTADIRKPTKDDPISITNDKDNNVHPEDWRTVSKCLEFLENLPNNPEHWMLYCSVNIPHPAFQTNATWLSYVNLDNVTLPPWPPQADFHPADSYMSISKNVWRNFTDEEILRVRKTYYAMCAETDYLLGRVVKSLNDTGHFDNTYIIFLSDHGEMNMEHRQVWKNSMYEASARVPMTVSGPGILPGQLIKNLTSLLDVYPTLMEMAGGVPPDFLDGHSLFPFLQPSKSPTNYPADRVVTSQYHSNMGNTGSFMIRSGKWKYITFGTALPAFKDYRPQLFDLDADPDELKDLSSSNFQIVKELDAKLRSIIDYPEVDKTAKATDQAVYKKYFTNQLSEKNLREQFEKAYKGFDDDDWNKIQAWANETP